LEVLTALAIFVMAMGVFASIYLRNGQIAAAVRRQNLATRLCQSKLHEVVAGVVPMTSQDDTPFDEEPDYTWSLEADNGPTDGLWLVTVSVKRTGSDENAPDQCTLTQMVLDPSTVGSNEDVVPVTSSTTTNGGSSSGTGSSGTGSTTSGGSTTGGTPSGGTTR
jgi:uncharacterized membrane protein YgcG